MVLAVVVMVDLTDKNKCLSQGGLCLLDQYEASRRMDRVKYQGVEEDDWMLCERD